MRKKLILTLSSIILLSALLATPVLANDLLPNWLDSRWESDPLFQGKPNPNAYKNAEPGDKVPGYWWRDTTNQNAIHQYYFQNYQPRVENPAPGVFVFTNFGKSQVVGLVGETGWVLIDTLESPERMAPVVGIMENMNGLPIKALIYTSEKLDHLMGSNVVEAGTPVYASSQLVEVFINQYAEYQGVLPRIKRTIGQALDFGPDGRLGLPTEVELRAFRIPSNHITEPTVVDLVDRTVVLIPSSSASHARLMVYLPVEKVLIQGYTVTSAFPDIGPLTGSTPSIDAWISDIDTMIALDVKTLISTFGNGMIIKNNPLLVDQTLTNYRDAIQHVHDRTLVLMNTDSGLTLTAEDIVPQVNLPDHLASLPYLQEFENNIPSAVKAIYHEHAGWFNGAPPELASTLSTTRQAEIMADLAGGMTHLIDKAKKAELDAQDLPSAEEALLLAYSAYKAAIDSEYEEDAAGIYIQALKKNAYMQKSDQIRNYYLSTAKELEIQYGQ
ncbi:alkyl sulfatase dimerization domain-containing protein [Chloroflexota bacterium]